MKESMRRLLPRIIREYLDRRPARGERIPLDEALALISDAVFITDTAGTIRYTNRAFEELTGYTLEESIGKTPRFLKSGLYPSGFYREMFETVLAGHLWRGEVVNRHKKGHLFTVELSIFPIPNPSGAGAWFLAVQRDVTTQKRLLEEYSAKVSHEAMTDGILTLMDSARGIGEFLQILAGRLRAGFGADRCWLVPVLPSGSAAAGARYEDSESGRAPAGEICTERNTPLLDALFARVANGAGPVELDEHAAVVAALVEAFPALSIRSTLGLAIRTLSGATWLVLVHQCSRQRVWTPQEVELLGRVGRIAAIGIDHVQRRQEERRRLNELEALQARLALSELKYRSIFENAIEAIYQTTIDGTLITGNPALYRMLGYDSIEEMQSLKVDQALYPNPEERKKYVAKLLEEGTFRAEDLVLRRKDGRYVTVQESARVVRDPDGRPLHFEGTLVDVTHKKELERQLVQVQKMETVAQLAGGLAHDFNNLLTGIIGYTTLVLNRAGLQHELRANLENVLRTAERGAGLTQKLIAISRRPMVQLALTDLNALVSELLRDVGRTLDPTVRLESRLEEALPQVDLDSAQIRVGLLNLVNNARDAMPTGGRILIETGSEWLDSDFLRTRPWARGGQYVFVRVSDTGSGMDESTRAHLFEPFFTTKHDLPARGLGLVTVYGIAKAHNGLIDIGTNVGMGTMCTIYIPIARVQKPTLTSAPSEPTGRAILMVDDEDVVRDPAGTMLEEVGYRVFLASDGAGALEAYAQHHHEIGLVILDLTMPGMSGGEVLAALLAKYPACRVLLSSGYSMDASIGQLLHAGALGFLQKPYSLKELVERVRVLLPGA